MRVHIDPTLIEELRPNECAVESDVVTELVEHINTEFEVVSKMMLEIGDNNKLTASDIRLLLSLRGFNFCG